MNLLHIFGGSTQSRSQYVTSQSLINLYLEKDSDRGRVVAYGTPGLTLFKSFGDTPVRGMYAIDDDLIYCVHRNTFYSINNAGVATALGTLLTNTGRVDMSHNPTQIIIVDGTYGYIYTIGGAMAQIVDADFPGADTVAFNNGRFIVNKPDTGQYWISASYDGTAWDGADFATAEGAPDDLVRVTVDHGEVILLGAKTTEFAVDTGSLDFPYTRVSGATGEWGLAARWSVAKFDNSLIWLAKNRMGEVQVVRLAGYQMQRVSTFDIESIINNYATVLDATGFSYLLNGHPFYQLNFTSAGESWLYDGASDVWSKLTYNGVTRHRAEISASFTNKTFVSDYSTGDVYILDPDAYTDNGTPIHSELVSRHINNNMDRFALSQVFAECEGANGGQIMLQVSKDNGYTFGVERWASLGAIGDYRARAMWTRLGQARDWVFRLKITANIKRVILGLWGVN